MRRPLSTLFLLAALAVVPGVSPRADVSLNNMFGDHLVLQQGIRNKVWGRPPRAKPSPSPSAAKSTRRRPVPTALGR